MTLFEQTLTVFLAGVAGGLASYAMTRDPTSLVPFFGASVAVVIALLLVL